MYAVSPNFFSVASPGFLRFSASSRASLLATAQATEAAAGVAEWSEETLLGEMLMQWLHSAAGSQSVVLGGAVVANLGLRQEGADDGARMHTHTVPTFFQDRCDAVMLHAAIDQVCVRACGAKCADDETSSSVLMYGGTQQQHISRPWRLAAGNHVVNGAPLFRFSEYPRECAATLCACACVCEWIVVDSWADPHRAKSAECFGEFTVLGEAGRPWCGGQCSECAHAPRVAACV